MKTVQELKHRYDRLAVRDTSQVYNTSLLFTLELGFILEAAEAICVSALGRKESRGAHFRTDMPGRDDKNWLKHTQVHANPDGPIVSYTPVTITHWQPEERAY